MILSLNSNKTKMEILSLSLPLQNSIGPHEVSISYFIFFSVDTHSERAFKYLFAKYFMSFILMH